MVLAASPLALLGTAQAVDPKSPALCGPGDLPETGIQGDIPFQDVQSGRAALGYHCGLQQVGELALTGAGALQGQGSCAYVRTPGRIRVINLADPANPVEIGNVATFSNSETLRAVVNPGGRSILVSGRGVYDITTPCTVPVLLGQIEWRAFGAFESPAPSHDIRVNRAGTKVYASTALKVASLTNLADPATWTVKNYRCELARQAGHPIHVQQFPGWPDWCVLAGDFPYPTYSHSPDTNQSGTRLYIGGQVQFATLTEDDVLRVIDASVEPLKILDATPGPGHSVDWFRSANGREYVLHANEGGTGDTCQPYPRPSSLGWAFEAFITEVTDDTLNRVSMVELSINRPEYCQKRLNSGQSAHVAYHMVDNPDNAKFALVSFANAGLRMFDIRNPAAPVEVAYFNHGPLTHAAVSHYDAARGLIYVPYNGRLRVLRIQPKVLQSLGIAP